MAPSSRECRTCGITKPLTEEFFSPQNGYRDGFVPRCRVCVNAWNKAYKAEQRRRRGAKPKRKPRVSGGVEQWECGTPGCGWHERDGFYLNQRGTPRRLCKRCYITVSGERLRRPDVRARSAVLRQERLRTADPDAWGAKELRVRRRKHLAAEGLRRCPGPCGRDLPVAEFQPTDARPRGSRARCRECRNVQAAEYARRGREWDPERGRAQNHARKARIRGATVNDLTVGQWRRIRSAYGDRCAYCGRVCSTGRAVTLDKLTKDHAQPVTRGGGHSAGNVFPACYSCNAAKGARTPEEYAASTGVHLDRGPHPYG